LGVLDWEIEREDALMKKNLAQVILHRCSSERGNLHIRHRDPFKARYFGLEMRLVARSWKESLEIRRALKTLGIHYGKKPQRKGPVQWVISIYTETEVYRFLKMVKSGGSDNLWKRIQRALPKDT
jgi:hypothetical protein